MKSIFKRLSGVFYFFFLFWPWEFYGDYPMGYRSTTSIRPHVDFSPITPSNRGLISLC